MGRISFVIAVAVLFTVGCGTIKEKTRMTDFDNIARAYEHIMLESDFETAMEFTDSEAGPEDIDYTAYEDFKIVDYQVKKNTISEDKLEVTRTIELKYYKIDSLIVRTIRYEQVWKYDEEKKTWLLQTPLPELK
ncbi:MAG: hypothetical protein JRK53_11045 [Deltaproteobacteria bacterium]|nr:hypothetical protein [Deltaproteobacteria bacterium]